jgi:hypothetical protein
MATPLTAAAPRCPECGSQFDIQSGVMRVVPAAAGRRTPRPLPATVAFCTGCEVVVELRGSSSEAAAVRALARQIEQRHYLGGVR